MRRIEHGMSAAETPARDEATVRDVLARIGDVWNASEPNDAAWTLAETLKGEGLEHELIYACYLHYFGALSGDEASYDHFDALLEWICSGPWAKGKGLFGDREVEADRETYFEAVVRAVTQTE